MGGGGTKDLGDLFVIFLLLRSFVQKVVDSCPFCAFLGRSCNTTYVPVLI